MPITLDSGELQTLSDMRAQAQGGFIGYWEIYKWLGDTLLLRGVGVSDPTYLWLRGATEANAGRGAMATLIREYTATQYELRYGSRPSEIDMQMASNDVAKNLIADILGEREPQWPGRQVPNIARIALADSSEIPEPTP